MEDERGRVAPIVRQVIAPDGSRVEEPPSLSRAGKESPAPPPQARVTERELEISYETRAFFQKKQRRRMGGGRGESERKSTELVQGCMCD